jgi:hypothetical protein
MQKKLCAVNSKLILSAVGHRYLFHLLVSWLTSSGLAVVSPAVQKETVYVCLEPSTVTEFNTIYWAGSRLWWLKRPALHRPTLFAIIMVLDPDDVYKVGV